MAGDVNAGYEKLSALGVWSDCEKMKYSDPETTLGGCFVCVLYWKAHRIVPYAATLARVCIVCTAFLMLPIVFYAVVQKAKYPTNDEWVLRLGSLGGRNQGCILDDAR